MSSPALVSPKSSNDIEVTRSNVLAGTGYETDMNVNAQVSTHNKEDPTPPPVFPTLPKVSPEGNVDVNMLPRAVLSVSSAGIGINNIRRRCSHHDILVTQRRDSMQQMPGTEYIAAVMVVELRTMTKTRHHTCHSESRAPST